MGPGGSSAWEQWGGKRPAGTAVASATDAFQSLLRSSPLSRTSTASSTDSERSFSLTKVWASAREYTQIKVASVTTPVSDAETMESAMCDSPVTREDENASASWPLWRKQSTDNSSSSVLPSMSWNTRFKYFVGLAFMGLMFFGMASIFLPLIMIRPSKFALSFTFGSICAMGAFAMLKGPAAYLSGLLELKKLPLTGAYVLTLVSTLYSCLVLGNYILVVCSSVLQLVTLSAFALSALPGGQNSLKAFGVLFWKTARRMVQALARLFK